MTNNSPEIITITRLPIRLGQFLKLTEIALEGSEATALIASGRVYVNAVSEIRRGRKLYEGDIITVNESVWCVAREEQNAAKT